MKSVKLYISLLFIICTHYGFGQCIVNGDFASWCGHTSADCSSSFDQDCVPNWKKSHGSPTFVPGATAAQNAIFMFASTGAHGEGIFGSYNFEANHQYTVKVAAVNGGDNGNLVVLAANNIGESSYSDCGGQDLPHVVGTTIIMNQFLQGGGSMTEYTITFTPLINYSQVWIYPSTFGQKMEMTVDYISICPDTCTGNVTYNTGAVPGGTTRAGFIYAGSSSGTGGSGTVTVQNGLTTSFIGGDDIFLQPEFHVSLTSGEFRALVVGGCGQSQSKQQIASRYPSVQARNDPNGLIKPGPRGAVSTLDSSRIANPPALQENVSLFPNPARSKLNVMLGSQSKILSIDVLNEMGMLIKRIDSRAFANKQKMEIDVSTLQDGLYILRIITEGRTITQKFKKTK
jgi:hypothetical protein